MTTRPDWDAYFMAISRAVAARADCTRARYGAVIVDVDRRIVSTGYNGSPPNGPSCLAGECPRGQFTHEELPGYRDGNEDYASCVALHAEQNAIAWADRSRTAGGTIYIAGGGPPCNMCAKLVAAAGIVRTVHE